MQRARTDIKKPIEKIEVYRADHSLVKSGNPQKQGGPLTTFEVCKQNALWMIDCDKAAKPITAKSESNKERETRLIL